jgi:hypothetical protein
VKRFLLLVLGIASVLPLFPQTPAKKAVTEGFRQDGPVYYATASGTGSSQSEAQEKARGAALRSLFAGLGKDRLFAEVFMGSPPVGLSFSVDSSGRSALAWAATVTARIDDESVRIVERGSYLAAAISLLDQAESAQADAADKASRASAAEANGQLGEALGSYGMARDSSSKGLSLMESIGDSTVFSSRGKRTAPDLRRSLASVRDEAVAGIARVRKADAALAADDASKAAADVIEESLASADKAQALLDETNPIVGDVTSYGKERLVPVRDKLAIGRRSLGDSRDALLRAAPSLPKERGYLRDKLEYARRRLDTQDASLLAAWKTVDQEIRDPAVRRAARAQAWRWTFLHVPKEYLGIRVYPALGLSSDAEPRRSPFDMSGSAEGAFGTGGGVWVRSVIASQHLEIGSEAAEASEFSINQSFDLGFWGRSLYFVGYSWDWYRSVDGTSLSQKPGLVRFGFGGVERQASGLPRADWNLCLSYEIPYRSDDFLLWNVVNAGLDAQFRLGDVAVLEAKIAHRAHRDPELLVGPGYMAVFSWSAAVAIRLPPPFTWGAEYYGSLSRPMNAKGEAEDSLATGEGNFRFFIGYSL